MNLEVFIEQSRFFDLIRVDSIHVYLNNWQNVSHCTQYRMLTPLFERSRAISNHKQSKNIHSTFILLCFIHDCQNQLHPPIGFIQNLRCYIQISIAFILAPPEFQSLLLLYELVQYYVQDKILLSKAILENYFL